MRLIRRPGEIIDELAMAGLGNLNEAREKKIENMLLMVKNLESDAEQLKAEKQAFDQRQRVALNKAEWLKKNACRIRLPVQIHHAKGGGQLPEEYSSGVHRRCAEASEECIKRKEPEVDKTALGKLFKRRHKDSWSKTGRKDRICRLSRWNDGGKEQEHAAVQSGT